MGRFCGKVPNDDPERLSRIMDEKRRMFGVDKPALDKQAQERSAREAQESASLRAFAQKAEHLDAVLCTQHQANEQQRRALNRSIDGFRQLQTAEKSQRLAHERAAEAAANRAEQAAHLSSPWLNEDPRLERSAMSPNRVRKDHWKGMSDEQLKGIRDMQAIQVTSKAQQEQQARVEQQAYDCMQLNFASTMSRQAAEVEAAKRQEAGRLAGELQRQILEKRNRDGELGRLYNSQTPTGGYFAQFGTSHR